MTILITGAGGKTGRTILNLLSQRNLPARAWVRRDRALPQGVIPFLGDMTRADDWQQALVGVRQIYHICPNMHRDEVQIGTLAIQAAQRASVERFVYHSVLHPQTEAMPHHWHKLRVEEQLVAGGLPFTILQPTAYMQNIRPQWPQIVRTGRYQIPYPAATRIALVDLQDVATAAVHVLLQPGHLAATYQLVAEPNLSQSEVAAALAAVAGRPVTVDAITPDEWSRRNSGLDAYSRDTLVAMFRYYAAHGLPGSSNHLSWLLGRPPVRLHTVIARWRDAARNIPAAGGVDQAER